VKVKKPEIRRCTAITRSGKSCQAAPVGGTKPPRCLMHQPGVASLMGTRGGHRRAIFDPSGLVVFQPPKTTDELLEIIATMLIEIREGRMDPKVANSFIYGAACYFKGNEMKQLNEVCAEIAALKKRLESRVR